MNEEIQNTLTQTDSGTRSASFEIVITTIRELERMKSAKLFSIGLFL